MTVPNYLTSFYNKLPVYDLGDIHDFILDHLGGVSDSQFLRAEGHFQLQNASHVLIFIYCVLKIKNYFRKYPANNAPTRLFPATGEGNRLLIQKNN